MQGIVSRMKAHQESCRKRKPSEHEESKSMKITKFVSATSKEDKNDLDKKVASYFYARNTPFSHVEHKTFAIDQAGHSKNIVLHGNNC